MYGSGQYRADAKHNVRPEVVRGTNVCEVEMDYYERRAEEETERADAATDPVAAQVHRQLATLYRVKAAELGGLERLHIVPAVAAS